MLVDKDNRERGLQYCQTADSSRHPFWLVNYNIGLESQIVQLCSQSKLSTMFFFRIPILSLCKLSWSRSGNLSFQIIFFTLICPWMCRFAVYKLTMVCLKNVFNQGSVPYCNMIYYPKCICTGHWSASNIYCTSSKPLSTQNSYI